MLSERNSLETARLSVDLPQRVGMKQVVFMMVGFVRAKPLGAFSAVLLLFIVAAAVLAPWLRPYDPLERLPDASLIPPGLKFPMGTDALGRDILSRIFFGSRISLIVGLGAVGLATALGTIVGLLSGYWGGKADLIIQRIMDSLMAFPGLILALTLMAVMGAGMQNVILALAIVFTPGISRVLRGVVLSLKEEPFIEAARAIGCKHRRILVLHLFPNCIAPILVLATILIGNAIVIEASLSFLGVGTPPPNPSWGQMLAGSSLLRLEQAPWLAIFPGLAISVTVMSFNLLGDALRDILDPRLRGKT